MDFSEGRKFKKSFSNDLALTAFFCTGVGLFLRGVHLVDDLAISLVVSYCIGFSCCISIHVLLSLLRPKSERLMWFTVIPGILLGAFIGWQTGSWIVIHILSLPFTTPGAGLLRAMILGLVFGGPFSYFIISREKIAAIKSQMQEEQIRRLSSEKETLEANLRRLQAQIEPHFLFNTLSNIRSLMDTDVESAKSMLMDLNRYLRNTLKRTRCDITTLGQEIAIVEAYLNIFKIRMGDRLRYAIDIPENLKQSHFPPLLLQPLVENAIQHGLEPKVEGGDLVIRGKEKDGLLRLEILDTGEGFTGEPASGIGLSNVRDRLRLLYGERARVILKENTPHGVKAIIEVPDDRVL